MSQRWIGFMLAMLAALLADPATAETRALLIGVSHYASPAIPDLVGPSNDLSAMEALVHDMGASDVVSLRDAAVSRSSVEAALQQMGRRARPGDWILFYYSGHGAQAVARVRSASDGDYDQFVPLPGFDPANQDPERFIVDKDFYAWMKRYTPPDVRILMMVDSCHSGTMHRSVDLRAFAFTSRLAFRAADKRPIALVARPGPRLPALQAPLTGVDQATQREDLPNLIYIGASRDDQLALETELPQESGPRRGVLTFAFEQGLKSMGSDDAHAAADLDGDGEVTVLEMSSYLNSQVRMLTAQRQESTAFFPSPWTDLPLFSKLPAPRLLFDDPPPAVAFTGGMGGLPAVSADRSYPWRVVDSPKGADFRWMMKDGDVVRRSGDIVASHIRSLAAFEGVMEKWRTVMALRPLVSELNLRMAIEPDGSDVIYQNDMRITLKLTQPVTAKRRPGSRYVTVFNLASDGTVQLLYPLAVDGDGLLTPATDLTVLETSVVPPYGADHVVALGTTLSPDNLRAALRAADGQRGSGRLIALIRAELKRSRGNASLSIAELYTGP
jgi:hypothetical protein